MAVNSCWNSPALNYHSRNRPAAMSESGRELPRRSAQVHHSYGDDGPGEETSERQNTTLSMLVAAPRNAGRKIGTKRALEPRQVWAIRFFLDQHGRMRD